MNHRKFSELRAKMDPAVVAANEIAARQELAEILLSEMRKQSGKTQTELARALGVSQPTLSQIESQDDIQVSTLRRVVEALGGELDLVVRLPQGEFHLRQFDRAS
jgi:transcriptional regulator with XRE-family HTH domain